MLTACPICDYPLAGLPAAHRCPECGFEYDESTRVWRQRRHWLRIVTPALFIPAGAALCYLMIAEILGGHGNRVLLAVTAFAGAFAAVAALAETLSAMRYDRRLVVGRVELGFRRNSDVERVRWAEVGRVEETEGGVLLLSRAGTPLACLGDFIPDPRVLEDAVGSIAERAAVTTSQ